MRIKKALEDAGVPQEKFAEKLGITRAAVNERLNKELDIDSYSFINAVTELTGKSREWLYWGDGPNWDSFLATKEIRFSSEVNEPYLSGAEIRPITVTVDAAGNELVSYVPVKAQAGYMRGYGDAQYVERLPAFSLPALAKNGTYRMFQVDGPSMQQLGGKGLKDGDIVIAQYVEDIFDLRDNRVYVVVSTEGIAIKRVINRLKDKESPCLVMMSDNKNGEHPNYLLKPKQILEVWEAKKYISADFSFDTDMYQILAELQVEQARIKEELQKLRKP